MKADIITATRAEPYIWLRPETAADYATLSHLRERYQVVDWQMDANGKLVNSVAVAIKETK